MRLIKAIITIGIFFSIFLQHMRDFSTYAQFNPNGGRMEGIGGKGVGVTGIGVLGGELSGGSYAGGPTFTGSKVCVKDGVIMTGSSGTGIINFFCCSVQNECENYNMTYGNGSGNIGCTSDGALHYCPISTGINFNTPVLIIEKFFLVGGNRYTGSITNGMSGIYQVVVSNFGSGIATGLIIKDSLPTLFNYISHSTNTGTATYNGGLHEIDRIDFSVQPKSTVKIHIDGFRNVISTGIITNFANILNVDYCSLAGSNCSTQLSHNLEIPISGSCNNSVMTGYYSGINMLPNGGSLCINGVLSGLSQSSSGRSRNCNGLYGGPNQNNCNLQILYCGDNITNGTESCDDGNNNPNDGCFQCAFESPTCTLGLSPNAGIAPLGVTGSRILPTWINATSLDRGDSTIVNNPINPQIHNYISNGQYTAQLLIKNNLSGSTLTGFCTGIVSVSLAPIHGVCGINNNVTFYSLLSGGSLLSSGSAGLCNPGIVSGFSYNNGTRNRYCAGVNSGNTATCSATESYCGDGIIGTGVGYSNTEQCDDNNNIAGDGCGPLCGFETPTCSLFAIPLTGYIPHSSAISRTSLPSWITAQSFDFGNGSPTVISPTGTQNTNYLTAGNYTATLIIKNNLTGSSVTNQCTVVIQALQAPVTGNCNTSLLTSYYSGVNTLPNSGSLCSSGVLANLNQTSSGRSWSCLGTGGGASSFSCNFSIEYCGDGIIQGGMSETCDNQTGCNVSCLRNTGSCTTVNLTLTPNSGVANLFTTLLFTTPSDFQTTNVQRGDSSNTFTPISPSTHTYSSTGNIIGSLQFINIGNNTISLSCPFSVFVTDASTGSICGGLNQLPCGSGSACTTGLVNQGGICLSNCNSGFNALSGSCVSCGGTGEVVCTSGSACSSGLVNSGGICVVISNTGSICGGLNQLPCGSGSACITGLVNQGGICLSNCNTGFNALSGSCVSCGGTGEVVCTSGSACSSGLVNQGGICLSNCNTGFNALSGSCVSCGGTGEVVCTSGSACTTGLVNQGGICLSNCNAGFNALSGSCVSCGGTGEVVCTSGSACTTGLVNQGGICLSNCNAGFNDLSGSCVSCGGTGEVVCTSGSACSSGLVNSGGICVVISNTGSICGGLNQLPCTSGSACTTGLVNQGGICLSNCNAGFNALSGNCVSCGGTGEVVCTSGSACSSGLVNSGGICVIMGSGSGSGSTCGGVGQIICTSGSACTTGLVNQGGICLSNCNAGFNDLSGSCVSCGGTGEVVCTSGSTCSSGLVNSSGICVSSSGLGTGGNTGSTNTINLSNGSEYIFQDVPVSPIQDASNQMFGTSVFTQTIVTLVTKTLYRMINIPFIYDLGELYIYNSFQYITKTNTVKKNPSSIHKVSNNKASEYSAKKPRISYLPKFASLIPTFIPSEKPFIADPRFTDPNTPIIDLNAYDRKNTNNSITSNEKKDTIVISQTQKENTTTNNQGINNYSNETKEASTHTKNNLNNNNNLNSLEDYTIDTMALKTLFLCQSKSNINQNSLEECIKKLPKGNCTLFKKQDTELEIIKENINNCVPEAKLHIKPEYEAVQGALYINRDNTIEEEISFLQQFIPSLSIHNENIFYPFIRENIARIEFDPYKISNEQMEILLDHLSESDYLGSFLEKLAIQIPLFHIAALPSFNDPLKNKQSYLQTIKFSEAENICNRESPKKISVAIVDSAFETDHEDLTTNIKGFYDIANKDEDVNPPFGKDNDTEWSHGTYSAGIIGAVNNNQKGIISIAGDISNIYIYKAAKDNGPGSDIAYGAESLIYAAKNKPQIISLSRGAYINDKKALSFLEKLVNKISDQGSIIVASAGNYNKSEKFYPAAFDKVVSVGAIDNNSNKASFSNYGDRVDIAAPGKNIMTTSLGNLYESIDGTSESAPLVAGALAWIMSKGGTLDDLESSMSPINSAVGKGAINLEKTCKLLVAKYDNQDNKQHYAPDDKDLKKDFETQFKNQSNQSNQSTGKMIFGLLLLILIIILGALIHKIREKHII